MLDLFGNKTNSDMTLLRRLWDTALGKSTRGRDVYGTFGYLESLAFAEFYKKFKRNGIAKRIIVAMPATIWARPPTLQENDNVEVDTPFESEFRIFARRMRLWNYLNRVDKLSRLGEYAILMIGVNDGGRPQDPMGSLNSLDDIAYLRPYSQENAEIASFNTDALNPRYGMPETYRVKLGGYKENSGGAAFEERQIIVHHSRVIHVAEGLLENDIYGEPALEAVFNNLVDLEKVLGGSAEMFWLNGRGGMNFDADSTSLVRDLEAIKAQIQDYMDDLTRSLFTKGINVKPMNFAVADPTPHITQQLDIISGATGIPKRILIGSERGELASSQDEYNWLSRVAERREDHCEPVIVRPFIDRLIQYGAMRDIEYRIAWPKLEHLNEKDYADIAFKKAQALSVYANSPGADLIVPQQQFVRELLNIEYREADILREIRIEQESLRADQESEQAEGNA